MEAPSVEAANRDQKDVSHTECGNCTSQGDEIHSVHFKGSWSSEQSSVVGELSSALATETSANKSNAIGASTISTKLLLGMYSTIIFWTGAWNILSLDPAAACQFQYKQQHAHWQRDLCYVLIGHALVIGSGTLYAQASILGTYLPEKVKPSTRLILQGLGVIGVPLLWVGMFKCLLHHTLLDSWSVVYDLDDDRVTKTSEYYWKDILLLIVGYLGLKCTGLFWSVAMVFPETWRESLHSSEETFRERCRTSIRALICLWSQSCVLVASASMCAQTKAWWWRLLLWSFGCALLLCTPALRHPALLQGYRPPDWLVAMAALFGALAHNCGCWAAIEFGEWLLATQHRLLLMVIDLFFIIFGLGGLQYCGILREGFCLSPIVGGRLRPTQSLCRAFARRHTELSASNARFNAGNVSDGALTTSTSVTWV